VRGAHEHERYRSYAPLTRATRGLIHSQRERRTVPSLRRYPETVGARMRLGAALTVVVLLVAGMPRVMEPSSWMLLAAVRELGPLSGWRCARSATYVYDPRRERADSTLLAQPPEQVITQAYPGVEIEKVEANLRGGDTVVWTRVAVADDGLELDQARVYVLSPGRLQSIAPDKTMICNSHLADWHIVAEHALS